MPLSASSSGPSCGAAPCEAASLPRAAPLRRAVRGASCCAPRRHAARTRRSGALRLRSALGASFALPVYATRARATRVGAARSAPCPTDMNTGDVDTGRRAARSVRRPPAPPARAAPSPRRATRRASSAAAAPPSAKPPSAPSARSRGAREAYRRRRNRSWRRRRRSSRAARPRASRPWRSRGRRPRPRRARIRLEQRVPRGDRDLRDREELVERQPAGNAVLAAVQREDAHLPAAPTRHKFNAAEIAADNVAHVRRLRPVRRRTQSTHGLLHGGNRCRVVARCRSQGGC